MTEESTGQTTAPKGQTRGKSTTRRGQKETDREVEFLRQQVVGLTVVIDKITGDERITNAIAHGVDELAAELRPLRNLRPPSTGERPEDRVIEALRRLRRSLESPDWSGAGSVPSEDLNVAFIGEAPQPRPPAHGVAVFVIEEKEPAR
jgi:hypothetical protein